MKTTKTILMTAIMIAAMATCSQAGLIIYEDVSETATNDAPRVNHAHIYADSSGLVDYVTGAATSVGIIGTPIDHQGAYAMVLPVAAGTDYASIFGGVLDISGTLQTYTNKPVVNGRYDWSFSITGLNPGAQYELVLASNSNKDNSTWAGADMWKTNYTIMGADDFTNTSSTGVAISTTDADNDTASVININNERGYVARFDAINPGSDGVITIRVRGDVPDPNFAIIPTTYMNGFRLMEVPEPATMSLLGLGGLAMLRRRSR